MSVPPKYATLRAKSEYAAGSIPQLLVEAQQLAASVAMGEHGRRRSGVGEDFWQYRQAMPGDELASVDWRRSGRSDTAYVREREWETAHTVAIWSDDAQSMDYRGNRNVPSKRERSDLLALALSILLSKAGERVSFPATVASTPRSGERQLQRVAMALTEGGDEHPEYGSAPDFGNLKAARSVFISDFLGDENQVFPPLIAAAEAAGLGCLVQVLDDTEESFPFDGRMIFESMGGAVSFETQRAKGVRDEYKIKMAERSYALEQFAQKSGWHYLKHHISESPRSALLWLHTVIGGLQ